MNAGSKSREITLGPNDLWAPWTSDGEVPELPTGSQNQNSPEKNNCAHLWIEIELFRFTAFYCHKCGIKREELK
jgi:hypothetical protein